MSNVLLVTADSIRADYCGFLNGPDTTPFLSDFANRSVVYQNAIAPGPRTPSSVPISMTGERFRTAGNNSNQDRLERIADHIARFNTLPEMLSRDGYTTAAVTANPWTTGVTGFDAVFDEFIEIGTGHGDAPEHTSTAGKLANFIKQWRQKTDWFAQWPAFYDQIIELVDKLPEPWFIWVFLLDTHSPYVVPREDRTESNIMTMYYSAIRYNLEVMRRTGSPDIPPHLDTYLQESYRDTIRSVDRFLESIVGDLPTDTSLVFHSDHGEAFDDNGTYGHQEELYTENVHVPLLAYNGIYQENIAEPTSIQSVPEMVCDLASETFSPKQYSREYVYSSTEFGDQRSVRTKSHAAIAQNDEVQVLNREDNTEIEIAVNNDAWELFQSQIEGEFRADEERERIVLAAKNGNF